MKTLGLDLSTIATGWSLFEGDQLVTWGLITPPEGGFTENKKLLNLGEKYFYITQEINILIKMFRPKFLAIEDTFMGKNPVTFKALNRLAGQIIYAWFVSTRTEPNFYMATTARAAMGINGKATKKEVTQGVNEYFKLRGRVKDDNVADAIVVGFCDVTKRTKARNLNVGSRRSSS